ncbi:MAG TPA: HlyD family efflux transporter periplasmic adaptor subunit [Thermoanaerobaculia bacterium]
MMGRRPSRTGALWTALGLAVLLGAFLPLAGSLSGARDGDVPVFRVERAPFERRVPAQGNLQAVRATPIGVPPGAPGPFRIGWLAPDGTRVKAGDVVVRFDPSDMVKQLAEARDDEKTSGLKIEKQRIEGQSEAENLDRTAGLAREELENAKQFQKKDELIYSRGEIVESEIDQQLAREKEQHARSSKQARQKLSGTELELLAISRRRAEHRIRMAQQGLQALEVKAPHDGVLVLQRDFRGEPVRVGDTVWMGQPLAEIPDPNQMEAEVYVLEADAGGLAPGKRAEVILESRPDQVFPAEIRRVDALAKPRLRGSPVQYFAVVLKLATTDPRIMKPGQRVRATLLLEERKEALAIPRQAVFEREGKMVVYRRQRGAFEPAEVTLGPSGMGKVVVEKGIEPGDVLALADPTKPREKPAEEGEETPGSAAPAAPAAPGSP